MSNLDCVGIGREGMISSLSTFAWRLHGKSPFQHHAFPSVQVLISRPPFTGLLPFKFSMFIDEITLKILHWINPSLAILLLFKVFHERRPLETVGVNVVAKLFETVGLSVFLTWWGTRTNPFE